MNEMKSLTLNGKTYDSFYDSVSRSLAVGSAVIDSASGENIVVTDASNYNFTGLRIFGKTTQDGTPTPDAPVELVSVGDNGSITVNVTGRNDAKSMTIATPNGLPGIPVESDGNYTDSNGQQWVCDEVDFARGVYVRRIQTSVLSGGEPWVEYSYLDQRRGFAIDKWLDSTHLRANGLCNQFPVVNGTDDCVWLGVGNATLYVVSSEWVTKGLDAWKQHLGESSMSVMYARATPIETPLSDEELAAYADLQTYRNNTTVSNDASAHMEIEYVMDAKKYFDSLGGGASAGLVEATVE